MLLYICQIMWSSQLKSFMEHTKGSLLSHYRCRYFGELILMQCRRLELLKRYRTSEAYMSAYNSFKCFLPSDIEIYNVDNEIIDSYQAWLRSRGISFNTVSFYMRILRAVFNKAVDRGLVKGGTPFKNAYTGIAPTIKRAISADDLKKIMCVDLTGHPSLRFARDMFLFSFYCRGISYIDIAYLKKKNLVHGFLSYRRRKTGSLLSIKWEKPMQDIVDRYFNADSEFLFPIFDAVGSGSLRRHYRNSLKQMNRNLKQVARMAQVDVNLTTYVARHSWASVAHECNVPVSVISGGMGHRSESTTMIYLASIDTSLIDSANHMVISCLNSVHV